MFSAAILAAMFAVTTEELTDGAVQTVAEGFAFTEGPVWLPSNELVFSDIPADTIYKADKTVYRKPSGKSNGLTLDPQGRLIACEHWTRRVTRTEKDGAITILAETFEGKKLNSPNDVICRSDGTIFFTDPPYGLEKRPPELPFAGVFAIMPNGALKLLVSDFKKPNGLALSPDESVLYVADTEAAHIRAFDLAKDATLSGSRIFCAVPGPDGMKVDTQGNIWTTSSKGMEVFDPKGKKLGVIGFPQTPANCAFGDVDAKTLYVTARTAVYKMRCKAPGIRPGVK